MESYEKQTLNSKWLGSYFSLVIEMKVLERKLQEISYLKFGKELGTELVRVVQESTENLAVCKDVSMLQLILL